MSINIYAMQQGVWELYAHTRKKKQHGAEGTWEMTESKDNSKAHKLETLPQTAKFQEYLTNSNLKFQHCKGSFLYYCVSLRKHHKQNYICTSFISYFEKFCHFTCFLTSHVNLIPCLNNLRNNKNISNHFQSSREFQLLDFYPLILQHLKLCKGVQINQQYTPNNQQNDYTVPFAYDK